MLDMWRIGKSFHGVIDDYSAEVKSCAEHGLELKGNGVVHLVSQINK
jgi:hypothetical protein